MNPILSNSVLRCAFLLLVAVPLSVLSAQDASHSAENVARERVDRFEVFPVGQLFPSLIASLKEPQLRNSLLTAQSERDLGTLLGITEQGASIALWRMNGRRRGDGLELGIQGSASAQFDLLGARWTLLNADYTFAYPITYRHGAVATRFRYFHVSSHLGDRYLLLRPEARRFDNAGYRRESLELISARTYGDSAASITAFGGGEYAYSVTPAEMKPVVLRGGADAMRRFHEFGRSARASWVGGWEVTTTQERGWNLGASVRGGLEVGRVSGEAPGGRRYRALFELYDGPATFGHFSRADHLRYVGLGCYVIP